MPLDATIMAHAQIDQWVFWRDVCQYMSHIKLPPNWGYNQNCSTQKIGTTMMMMWDDNANDAATAQLHILSWPLGKSIKKGNGANRKHVSFMKINMWDHSWLGKVIERWVEPYSELYSSENKVSEAALIALEFLPKMENMTTNQQLQSLTRYLTVLLKDVY